MNGLDEEVALGIAGGVGLLLIILIIWMIVLTVKFGRLKRAHRKLLGETGVNQLEDVLEVLHGQVGDVLEQQKGQSRLLEQQSERLKALKGRIGVHRFNAFDGQGSDLSFSVAIVNDSLDGVVLTGIHGRDQTFLYAKPLEQGQSSYMLTPEEKLAINLALQKG